MYTNLCPGTLEGKMVGSFDGSFVGSQLGFSVGVFDGYSVGIWVGKHEGETVGNVLGSCDGMKLGKWVGMKLGSLVGLKVDCDGAEDGPQRLHVMGHMPPIVSYPRPWIKPEIEQSDNSTSFGHPPEVLKSSNAKSAVSSSSTHTGAVVGPYPNQNIMLLYISTSIYST